MGKVKHGEAREQLMPTRPGTGASHQTQLQVEQVPALSILRTDTVFAKLPIHTLSRSGPIRIQINQTNAQGVQELYWSVSPSSVYGPPQLLAYKLCVFRAKAATDSTRILPLIPWQACHRFHTKAATDSIRKLPAIPRQSCH